MAKCYSTQGTIYLCGGVPELADGLDLGSSVARRGGSTPPFPTMTSNQRSSWRNSKIIRRLTHLTTVFKVWDVSFDEVGKYERNNRWRLC